MRKTLEYLAAAAGMAEGGDRETALQLMAELKRLKKSSKARILVVGEDSVLSGEAAMHLGNLARRLSSEVLYLPMNTRQKDPKAETEGFRTLKKGVGEDVRLVQLPAFDSVEQYLRDIVNAIHVEFAVLVGRKVRKMRRHLHVPVFTL